MSFSISILLSLVQIVFMKIVTSLIIFLLVLSAQLSFAQNSIFMGKIIDESSKAVPGARIKVSKAGTIVAEVEADNDGLYYTQLLPSGYYVVDIIVHDKRVKAHKVFLKEQDRVKWFYNFKLMGEKAELILTANDPFMQHKLGKIEEEPTLFDFGGKRMFTVRAKSDPSSGQIIGVSFPATRPEAPPQVK
jgi:hypothetical protein